MRFVEQGGRMRAVDPYFNEQDGAWHYADLRMALQHAEDLPDDALFVIDDKDDMDFMRMYQKYANSRS